MGHGAARALDGPASDRLLDKAHLGKLTTALERLDRADETFKTNRDDMRFAQRAKLWGATSKEVDAWLRELGNLLHDSHQISLDIGSDGGGHGTKPWVEDGERKFPRLYFKLLEGDILAVSADREVGRSSLAGLAFEWVESMVVTWIVSSAEARAGKPA